MSKRLVVTHHRPAAGQELLHTLVERHGVYGVHAFSPASAWPALESRELNHQVLDRQPAGMTCCIVDHPTVENLVKILRKINPGAIVHAPFLGLSPTASPVEEYQSVVNGTLAWLEAARQVCPTAPFIHVSSTLVYGDRANTIQMEAKGKRLEFSHPAYVNGIAESFPIEGSTHSLPGAAAVAADVLAQEYARSYFLPVTCLRVDSVCDPGNGLHDRRDFLSQIAHACLTGTEYVVPGEEGRQVREILSVADLATLIDAIVEDPRPCEIFNVGGGRPASCSIAEAMDWIETLTGKTLRRVQAEAPPFGESWCYFTDTNHLRYHYPKWKARESWKDLARRVVQVQTARLAG